MQATLAELFDYAILLENAAQGLYTGLSGLFAHAPEVAHFWKHYADEERGHADYLARLRHGLDAQRLAEFADEPLLEAAKKCLSLAASERLKDVHNLEDAYELASELESSETNSIFEFLIVNFQASELEKSYKFLRAQLTTHIQHLQENFPAAYKTRSARQLLLIEKK